MSKDGRVWLSHTSLEVLQRCPRCFWLQVRKGIRQPEGIVSRLANRFDVVVKNYFDNYRIDGKFPPMVDGKLPGILQNPFVEKYFVRINEKYGFYGKLDECLVDEEKRLTPVDFKTSSSDPREKETLDAYKTQIDDYVFLISQNGKKVTGEGYLVYFYPDVSVELHNGFPMIIHIQKLLGNPDNTRKRIENAIKVLEGNGVPDSNPECVFCKYIDLRKVEE
ncbi:MAG: PD-(D/E)XK nuclease family protein [Candidatus Levybacteria bacterium]|nr:PD-(D/E)XK nuclease family protein [Candidatus Levybacteria bacterium]